MDPITEMRRIAAEHSQSWLGKCLLRYLTGRPRGLTLDRAFGVETTRGKPSWYRSERLRHRDSCIRWLAKEVDDSLSRRALAAKVHRMCAQYECGRWRRDQFCEQIPSHYFNKRSEILYRIFSLSKSIDAKLPGERQIRRIIGQTVTSERSTPQSIMS